MLLLFGFRETKNVGVVAALVILQVVISEVCIIYSKSTNQLNCSEMEGQITMAVKT
jgi:hypothetical protein